MFLFQVTPRLALLGVSLAVFPMTGRAQAPAPPNLLKFAVIAGRAPGSPSVYTGTVTFSRKATSHSFRVEWQLADGSSRTGFAVPYPNSGVIAVGYGEDLAAIAICRKDDPKAVLHWSPALPESAIGSYQLTAGDQPGVMQVENRGGSVAFLPGPEGTGTAEFNLTTGASSGITISQGEFTAIASGGKQVGVVLYQKTKTGVEGFQAVAGTTGAGTENLTILEVDGKKLDVPANPPAKPAAGPETAPK